MVAEPFVPVLDDADGGRFGFLRLQRLHHDEPLPVGAELPLDGVTEFAAGGAGGRAKLSSRTSRKTKGITATRMRERRTRLSRECGRKLLNLNGYVVLAKDNRASSRPYRDQTPGP